MIYGLEIYDKIEGEKFKAFFCSDNIMLFETNQNSEIELDDIKEMISLAFKILEKRKNKNLIIAGKYSLISSEAQKYMNTKEADINNPTAEAIVITSLSQRIIGNFYLSLISSKRPSKLFTSVDKAIEWLKSID